MSQYAELDRRIVAAVQDGLHPLYARKVRQEAQRIAVLTGRDEYRVIDGRIQALRRSGAIRFQRGKGAKWAVA